MDRIWLLRGPVVALLMLTSGAAAAAAQTAHRVVQKGKQFAPAELAVQVGDTVVFRNDDAVVHNVFTSSAGFEFNLKRQPPGSSGPVTFTKPGVAEVRCAIHPRMKLKITVR